MDSTPRIRTSAFALLTFTLLTLAAAHAHDRITTRVTWQSDISRIVQARCVGCHAPSGRAPMPLTTYAEARPWARAIKEEVLTRRMPKWHAARGYGDFVNDPSLSPFEIALVAAWADGGAPERSARAEGLALGTVRDKAETTRGNATVRSTVTLPCGERSLTGHLLAVRPRLAEGASAGIAALLPDGRREIVAWIRDYEPDFPTTYWLRTPIEMRRGSRLLIQGDGSSDCSVTVTLGRE